MLACIVGLSLVLSGCGGGGGQPPEEHGPFGPRVRSQLLAPFQGAWKFDLDKTLAVRKAAGASDEVLAATRTSYEAMKGLKLSARLTIIDNEALGDPFPGSEYRFFHLHRHNDTVCGKAWHHEDRYDPGDMSKCYVQLTLIDDCLHFRSHMTEGLPNLNDRDLHSPLPVDLDAADQCEADKHGPWHVMVFVRAATI